MPGVKGRTGTGARNPKFICDAMRTDGATPCGAYAIRGSTKCRVHGGNSPQVRNRKAKEAIASQMSMFDLPVPVEQKDFHTVAGSYVAVANAQVAALLDDLRVRTEGEEPVEISRTYGDVLDRIQALSREASKMMSMANDLQSASKGARDEEARISVELGGRIATAIDQILDTLDLSAEQRALVPTVVPAILKRFAAGQTVGPTPSEIMAQKLAGVRARLESAGMTLQVEPELERELDPPAEPKVVPIRGFI